MRAVLDVSLLALEAHTFHNIVNKNKAAVQQLASYAEEAVERLNLCERADLTDLDRAIFDAKKMADVAFEIVEEVSDIAPGITVFLTRTSEKMWVPGRSSKASNASN
uniref:Uncharacterized protein n=1 Tax=Noctiluca scintillans TaxID=2966 RepID=A0A7S0ZN28_NOCSC|mmetsp:Transcript_11839/g.32784  ORF Transcript_11839/g.32784 Transcript_11839/m.32784 type:complete len:107 (+) Transcript_11839:1-321(+)